MIYDLLQLILSDFFIKGSIFIYNNAFSFSLKPPHPASRSSSTNLKYKSAFKRCDTAGPDRACNSAGRCAEFWAPVCKSC